MIEETMLNALRLNVGLGDLSYTFAIFYKGSEAKQRAKSVVHFTGCADIDGVMRLAAEFRKNNPELVLGAAIPGIHALIP